MADFNKIHYQCSDSIFDTEERSAAEDEQLNTVKMCHHMPWLSAGLANFVEAEEA